MIPETVLKPEWNSFNQLQLATPPSTDSIYKDQTYFPHYPPHLGSNLAGSPPQSHSPRFRSPEILMAITPPPEHQQKQQQHFPQPKPGYKLTLGYKRDCELCINHVPGHYQHLELIVPDQVMTY